MIIYNYIYCILIAYFWIINQNRSGNKIIIRILIILLIILSSFNSIFIYSEVKLKEGLIFYLNQKNIFDLIVFKEILFFSQKGIQNLAIIIILIFALSLIENKKNIFFKVKYIKSLIIIIIFLNPIMINFIGKNFHFNDKDLNNINLKNYERNIIKSYHYDKNINNKNIIFFVVESLNHEFIENETLMPFLNNLSKKSINFKNIKELDLTNFTTTGLYALFCGNLLPNYQIFKEMKCFPEILVENNYNLSFVRADVSVLDELGINYGQNKIKICDFNCLKKKTELDKIHVWGVHDEVIFKETLNVVKKNNSNNTKFGIIAKTVDTHIEGYPSKNCKKNSYYESNIAKSFYCLDNLFKKFFNDLNNIANLKDTIIVIASDHLLMNKSFSNKFDKNSTNSFLIYDLKLQNNKSFKKKSTKLDVPATLLDALGIDNKIGVGVSIFSQNDNLIQKYENINSIFNSQKKEISFTEKTKLKERLTNFAKSNLKTLVSDDIYLIIKKKYHKANQFFAIIKYKYSSKNLFKKDLELEDYKLIAHAGGEIDGLIYTNSLEAINSSYNKGFKYIELDFLKTSDGHYVAAHDWKKWIEQTKYVGKLPPTLEDFKKYKLLNKYTPVTVYDINTWLNNKPEIILVTDKVTSPKDFLKFFDFKNQLMMEVFDYEAIIEAKEQGINFTVSDIFLYKNLPLNRDLLEKINTLGVKNLTASNIIINKDINFFIDAKRHMGMDIFFYQITDDLINIKQHQIKFLCNYPKLLSGGYFETANFKESLKC